MKVKTTFKSNSITSNYIVLDNTNNIVRGFNTLKEAEAFITYQGRYDWTIAQNIKYSTTTARQKAAVKFCEEVLQLEFLGDINNYKQVNMFLNEFLQEAKDTFFALKCEYEAYKEEHLSDY